MRLKMQLSPTKTGGETPRRGLTEHSSANPGEPLAWLARPSFILGIIGLYLVGHFALRLMLSPSLGIDDAEQTLFAQQSAFGYRFRQPPLFTWMLLPVTELVGPGVLAISLVRYVLLAITFSFLYLTARLCLHDQRMAGLAVLSSALIYVFAYYAHHDLTHSTALSAMIALAFYVIARLARCPSPAGYVAIGAVFGLGMLAKWNFAMLAIGLPLTCLLLPDFRRLVLTPKLVLSLVIMTVILAPTALWMLNHGQTIESVSSDILSGGHATDQSTLWREGGGALLSSVLLFPQPFLPIFLLLFGQSIIAGYNAPATPKDRGLSPAFWGSLALIILVLHVLLIPVFGAVTFTERWLHPALMGLPIFLFALAERGRPTKRRILFYLIIIAIFVAVAAGARLYRYLEGADDCGRCREFAPFAELADGLRARGFSHGTIIADGMHIGGNLKMLFAKSRVIDPAFPRALWPDVDDQGVSGYCLLVWREDLDDAEARRELVRGFALNELGLSKSAVSQSGRLDVPLIGSSSRRYALGFELYQEDLGGCR